MADQNLTSFQKDSLLAFLAKTHTSLESAIANCPRATWIGYLKISLAAVERVQSAAEKVLIPSDLIPGCYVTGAEPIGVNSPPVDGFVATVTKRKLLIISETGRPWECTIEGARVVPVTNLEPNVQAWIKTLSERLGKACSDPNFRPCWCDGSCPAVTGIN